MSRMSPTANDWEMLRMWLIVGFVPFTLLAGAALDAMRVSLLWAPVAGPVLTYGLWSAMVCGNYACGFKGKHWGDG